MQLLPAAARQWVKWKNKGGLTSEVATGPDGAGVDDFGWRVSIARIERDGPFSMFPGVDRTLIMLAGGPLILSVAGREITLYAGDDPFEFDGAEPVEARVESTATVLNVMARRGSAVQPETLILALRPMMLGDTPLSALDAVRFASGEKVPPTQPGDAIRISPNGASVARR
jgi:environmental stress-induced protein Ves